MPNILFVSEGFLRGRVGAVRAGRRRGRAAAATTSTATSPFNLLRDSINYWRLFVPSPQTGLGVLHDVGVVTRGPNLVGVEVPLVLPLTLPPPRS